MRLPHSEHLTIAWDYTCPKRESGTRIIVALDEYHGNPYKGAHHIRNEVIVLALTRTNKNAGQKIVRLGQMVTYVWPTISVDSLGGAVEVRCLWHVGIKNSP